MIRKIRKSYFLFFLAYCLLPTANCFSQMLSPDVKCVSVLPNGDVTITWTIPSPGNFVSYNVDTSSNPATIPFTTYTTVTTYTATSATHIGGNANTKRMYYRVETEYNPGNIISPPKDTFSTMFLSVTNTGGNALLNWNKISNLPISSSTNWYKIYREYPTGNWMFRDSTQNLSYTDITDVCNANNFLINYKIEIDDNNGCTSVSNVAGALLLSDNTPPTPSQIDSVSVKAGNFATISWILSSSPDADSVIIYKNIPPGVWTQIASLKVPITSYTYTASLASTVSEMFRIAFKDSCSNLSIQGIEHQTIFLSANFDICAATATLVWNKYINMNSPVAQYQIFKSVNAVPFTLLATNTANDTDYVDTNISFGNSYCYFIRTSTTSGKTSTSNKACFNANVTQPPTYNYNRYATVISSNTIDIKAHVDSSATSVKYYNLMRAINGTGSFSIVSTFAPPLGTMLAYTDTPVNTDINSYVYRWDAMDSCSNLILSSNPDTTILLKANVAANLDVTLSWNDYGNFDGEVDHYNIYRGVDGIWNPTPIGTATYTGNGVTFSDNVAPYFSSQGIFSYKIVPVEGSGNIFGFADSSASNIAKVFEYPKIYVPNAFTPNGDGINDIFIPIIGYIEPSEYSLKIFDNTGTPLMWTSIPTEGWDGKKHGHDCQEGVYMYLIQCKASNGDDSKISGTISLFR